MSITYKHKLIGSVSLAAALLVAVSPVWVAQALTDTSTVTVAVGSSITVASADSVSFSVTPTAAGSQSSDDDTVTVSTNSTAGYTLRISSSDTTNVLTSGGNTIAASANTYTVPAALTNNTWGYAIAGGNFDASYSVFTNVEGSTTKWAGMPVLASLQTIKTTATTASNDNTSVWYSAEVNSSQPNGTYTDVVTYTATAN
ncbi:hypothetical protein EOL73_04005 [Candidatus Saccharibacteria bacterium]|nr:hypothetical protein [Candidatus Saccharibacteria bacterium]NCU40893.1 hypothetical protein [Candidatus Saccharibacteria bacterium]